jgi:uncharacterized protein (DUF302 family)
VASKELITVTSSFGHGETLARLDAAIRANGLHIVAAFDHTTAALEGGVSLDATTVLMVGDGKRHAALVKAVRLLALDFPFKILVWCDEGKTLLSYNDFRSLAQRYGAGPGEEWLITEISVMMDRIARKAATLP